MGVLAVASALLIGCGSSPKEIGEYSQTEQPISYGDNDCWWTGVVNENWVDPSNTGSGEHVVAYYYCSDVFATPISVYAKVRVEWDDDSGWMVWQYDDSPPTYMVFVNGWWYWPNKLFLTQSEMFR
jgi:hypothetical protein